MEFILRMAGSHVPVSAVLGIGAQLGRWVRAEHVLDQVCARLRGWRVSCRVIRTNNARYVTTISVPVGAHFVTDVDGTISVAC